MSHGWDTDALTRRHDRPPHKVIEDLLRIEDSSRDADPKAVADLLLENPQHIPRVQAAIAAVLRIKAALGAKGIGRPNLKSV